MFTGETSLKDLSEIDELYHHGVKGQQWGVQNGPPYPLNQQGKNELRRISDSTNEYLKLEKKISQLMKDHKTKAGELDEEDRKESFRSEEGRRFWEDVIGPLAKEQERYEKELIDAGVNITKLKESIEHSDHLEHYGILGQKWGDQNGPPYPLNPSQKSYSEKKQAKMDKKWIRKNDKKIRRYADSQSKDELKAYEKELRKIMPKYNKNGKINSNYATAYSKKMADLYNKAIGDLAVGSGSGSGKVVKFVAARGQMDVFTALADYGYDMSNVRNGVYDSGRIGYRKESVGVDRDERR